MQRTFLFILAEIIKRGNYACKYVMTDCLDYTNQISLNSKNNNNHTIIIYSIFYFTEHFSDPHKNPVRYKGCYLLLTDEETEVCEHVKSQF